MSYNFLTNSYGEPGAFVDSAVTRPQRDPLILLPKPALEPQRVIARIAQLDEQTTTGFLIVNDGLQALSNHQTGQDSQLQDLRDQDVFQNTQLSVLNTHATQVDSEIEILSTGLVNLESGISVSPAAVTLQPVLTLGSYNDVEHTLAGLQHSVQTLEA